MIIDAAALRTQIIDLENRIKKMSELASNMDGEQAFAFILGQAAQSAQSLVSSMRDMYAQMLVMDKHMKENNINLEGEAK